MGIQINGQTDRISAVDGSFSIQDLAEVNVTGVATASNFKSGTSNVHSTGYECTNINATGIVTAASANFTGNVSVGGTLTYQDVTNIDSVGVVTARAGVKVPDNQKVFLGTDSDLEIYHDGSNARIRNTTGQLWLQSDNGIRFVDSDVNESFARFTDNGAVELYYDGSKKFETTSGGVEVSSGNLTMQSNGRIFVGNGGNAVNPMFANVSDTNTGIAFPAADTMLFATGGSESFRIDSNGRISVNSNANASDSNEGAQLRVTGTPITRNQYYSPAGDYYGSFGYTDNTYTKSWIAVDSSYNQASAVSSGIFLSAFHSDANGTACGHTIKNTRADGGGLIFSSVTTANSTGNPAVETERMRISTSGVAINKNSAADAELEIVQGADPTIRLHDTRNAAYKADFLMAGSGPLIRSNNTTVADRTLTIQKGLTDQLVIEGNGAVRKPLSPAFSANLSSGNLNAANHNNVIIFNNEHFDNGNNYNTSNGRFTAPVAGKYYFGVQIYAGFDFSGVRVLHAKFQKNGSDFATVDMFGGSSNHGGTYYHPTGCGHILIDLAVNDWVAFNSGGFSASGTGNAYIYAQGGTRFFGYLVG
jgi:hypothetical protein